MKKRGLSKRILAFVLSVMMVLALVPVNSLTVYADDDTCEHCGGTGVVCNEHLMKMVREGDNEEHCWYGACVGENGGQCTTTNHMNEFLGFQCSYCKGSGRKSGNHEHTYSSYVYNEVSSNPSSGFYCHKSVCDFDGCDNTDNRSCDNIGGICSVCGHDSSLTHTHSKVTHHEAKEASCIDGNIEYWECSCGKKIDSSLNEITDVTISATGIHDFLDEGSANYNGEKCSLCNVKNIAYPDLDIKAISTTYNDAVQTAVITGIEAENYTVTGNTATNAGKYTITLTGKGDYTGTREVEWTIMKATPTVDPPTSANPKYAGACVALVTAGSTNFGTMLYSLDDDDDYSENIPCADKGGDYTVYYKVEESDNWSAAAGSVEIQVPVRVDVTVVGDGSVNGYDPDEFYPVGTVLTLTAEPDEDYRFTGWDDDFDAPAERVWTVLADAKDNELTVNFQQKTVCYGAVCVYNDGINEVEATIDGDSNIPWSIPEEIRVQRVNLNRNFARQGYSTIVLPFDFEEIEVDEAEFYELDGVSFANDKWNVSVTPVSEVRPNTPYLIHVMKNNVSFSGDIALRPIDDDEDCSVTKNGWELCGTYEYKVWKDGNPELGRVYGFAAEERDGARIGQFVRLAYNASAKPLRAYLRYVGSPRPAPALFKAAPAVASIDELPESMDVVIRGEEGTTVIGTINTRTGEFRSVDNRWFDLNGRYLGNKKPTVKGTYYNNGKKVIVK